MKTFHVQGKHIYTSKSMIYPYDSFLELSEVVELGQDPGQDPLTGVATPAIFYSHRQLDILKAVLLQKSKAVARVARCPQYLQHVAKSSIR